MKPLTLTIQLTAEIISMLWIGFGHLLYETIQSIKILLIIITAIAVLLTAWRFSAEGIDK